MSVHGSAELDVIRRPLAGTPGVVARPDGTRLHTLEAGSGSAVLLVHGYSASIEEWSVVQPALVGRGHRVIAYDHRGHGRSTLGSGGATAFGLFDDLLAVVDHFGLEEVTIVAHSMGTFATMGALANASLRSRVRHAVLIGPHSGAARKSPPGTQLLLPLARLNLIGRLADWPPAAERIVDQIVGPGASPAIREGTRLMLKTPPIGAGGFIGFLNRQSVGFALPAMDVPATVVHGDRDTLAPRWHAELIAERAPRASLTVLPGIGHMVNWEAPDAILDAVEAAVRPIPSVA